MPALPKTSDEAVIAAARKIVAHKGVEALSMQALADKVGVRAPSLYKRFPDRDAVIDRVTALALGELHVALLAVLADRAPLDELQRMAHAYRAFAHEQPHLYELLFANRPTPAALVELRANVVAPVFTLLAGLVGPKQVLPAARLLVAFLHGFVSMELNGAFHLGGEIEEAFAFGLRTILPALERRR